MIVGIDFSINSTAVVIKQDNTHVYLSFVPNYNEKLKGFKTHEELKKPLIVTSYNKDTFSKSSVEEQSMKLRNADDLSDIIISTLKVLEITPSEIRIEGFSFGSKGNSFIDLITYNTFLKVKLIKAYGHIIKVVPPKTLKKLYTGNGNASKCDMLRTFMESDEGRLQQKIKALGFIKEDEEFTIPKPIDDVIDAIALTEIEI